MKKLLSLLSVITISGTAVPTTIAASPYQKEKNINNNINLQTNNLKNLIRNKRQPNNNVNYNIHINEIAPENPNWCEPAIAETILRYLYEIYHPNHDFPLAENWNGGSFQNYFVNNTYNPMHDRLEPDPQMREQLELRGHMGINYFEEGINWFINHFNLGNERYIFHQNINIFEGINWFFNGITNGLRIFYDYVLASLNRNLPPILFFDNFERNLDLNNNIISFGGIITGVIGNVNNPFDLNYRFLDINMGQEILIPSIFLVFILQNNSFHFYRWRTDVENNNLNQNNANNDNGAAPAARSNDYLVERKNYKLNWNKYEFKWNCCLYYYDFFSYSWEKYLCFPQKNTIWIPFIEEKIKDENILNNTYLRSNLETNSNRDKKNIGCSRIPKNLFKINTKVKLKENNSENLLLKKDQILFGTDYGFYLLNDQKIEKKFTNIINSPVIEIKLIDNNNGIFRLKNNKVYSFNLKDWNYKEIDENSKIENQIPSPNQTEPIDFSGRNKEHIYSFLTTCLDFHSLNNHRSIRMNLSNNQYCQNSTIDGKKITIWKTLNENNKGGSLQSGDTYIGTTSGVYLLFKRGSDINLHKFDGLDFLIKDIKLDGKGSAFVEKDNNSIVYHLNLQGWNHTEVDLNSLWQFGGDKNLPFPYNNKK